MRVQANITVDYSGPTYEHTYDNHLYLFETLARADADSTVTVHDAPSCWRPLIWYLGHDTDNHKPCELCRGIDWKQAYQRDSIDFDLRHTVEMACTCRPELVHALYLIDTRWPQRRLLGTSYAMREDFVVTTNGSFFRPEVQNFKSKLAGYVPTKTKCVLVPCAADKPYPAPLHAAVQRIVPPEFELIIATGVLGLIPESLWPVTPNYDSGIPHFFAVEETVAWYFAKWGYTEIIGYLDFYAHWAARGMKRAGKADITTFLLGTHYRDEYSNLLSETNLALLEKHVNR